jgi:hypothetical protein
MPTKRKIAEYSLMGAGLALVMAGLAPIFMGPHSDSDKNTVTIAYTKDDRTGLCFAFNSAAHENSQTLTYVPCNQQVIALIKDRPAP